MKNQEKKLKTFKVEALLEADLKKIIGGGYGGGSGDNIDCNSELASGGTTTDTY